MFDEHESLAGSLSETLLIDGIQTSVRKGGPKEVRMKKVTSTKIGRYYESQFARGETNPPPPEMLYTLRVDNLSLKTSEDIISEAFSRFGPLADVHRPINKDNKKHHHFVFVRFLNRDDMIHAMLELNGKELNGREMKISEARPFRFELQTSVY